MWVERIEELKKNRYKIFLDTGEVFCLFASEKNRFALEENKELSEKEYQQIFFEILEKRARLKAMSLLEKRDYTQKELEIKLNFLVYPNTVIERVLTRMKDLGYIDDSRYAKRYIENKRKKVSKNKLIFTLRNKGIKEEIFLPFMEEQEIDEGEQIQEQLSKKFKNKNLEDRKEKQKVYQSLVRKGYQIENILHALKEYEGS